jgi:hypothetical protein
MLAVPVTAWADENAPPPGEACTPLRECDDGGAACENDDDDEESEEEDAEPLVHITQLYDREIDAEAAEEEEEEGEEEASQNELGERRAARRRLRRTAHAPQGWARRVRRLRRRGGPAGAPGRASP